ncbi:MAG TPA: SDR family oxidoreductase [Streptosporangiaceae bacterium]|jgi:citronellol/citronellal dehydrogenase|nr:SDR family oxidoreductase [Streptosporangiaceae bacterium]
MLAGSEDVLERRSGREQEGTPAVAPLTEVLKPGALEGHSVVVTGAGSGIGRATARRLIALGARVTGLGRRAETLRETGSGVPESQYDFHVVDVRRPEALDAISEVGTKHGITGLVNNAGGQFIAPAKAISRKGWDAVIDLNLNAVFALTTAAYPFLSRDGGAVVNLSLSGVERGSMGMAHSIAARSAVLGLTRTLALEWAADRIRLNCIGPGTVVTEQMAGKYGDDSVRAFLAATPLGRGTSPEEVAELIAYLMSPAGELMSGQLLQIDGAGALGTGFHGLV